jgi:hypothetical protein
MKKRRANAPAPTPKSPTPTKKRAFIHTRTGCQPHLTSDSTSQPPATSQIHQASPPAQQRATGSQYQRAGVTTVATNPAAKIAAS